MFLRNLLVLFAVATGTWALAPSPASACGGTFCDTSQPVVQAAERIIFSRNADGTTTAIIQIQYQQRVGHSRRRRSGWARVRDRVQRRRAALSGHDL